jgi:hypothetical protein
MPADPQAIMRTWSTLYADQSNFRTLWQEIAEYTFPRKSNITRMTTPGARQTDRLFDSTAIRANEEFAAAMQGSLTSPALEWWRLTMRNRELQRVKRVADWLEECRHIQNAAYNDSNLYSELNENYLDLGAFGIGCLFVAERAPTRDTFSGFSFKALSPGEYVIGEDPEGNVDQLIRAFELSGRAATALFGESKLPEKIRETVRDKPEQTHQFLHAVYPRQSYNGTKRDASNMPFSSCYLGRDDASTIIAESGFMEFPFMVPRFAKTSGEVYGRGPGMTALPDVRTLNRAIELKLKSWAKVIDPPLLVLDDGVVGTVKLTPAALNVVRNLEAIRPLESGARFDVTAIEEENLKKSIGRTYYIDLLRLPDGPQMTATETSVRYEQQQRVLGPALWRILHELLTRLIERGFMMMYRRHAFPDPPPELQEGGDIDVRYEGPMSRAQRSADLTAISRTYSLVAPMAETHPEVLDNFDHDKIVRHIGDVAGMPSILYRSPEEVAGIRDARQQAHAQEQQMAQMGQVTEGIKNVSPALKLLQGGAQAPKEAVA